MMRLYFINYFSNLHMSVLLVAQKIKSILLVLCVSLLLTSIVFTPAAFATTVASPSQTELLNSLLARLYELQAQFAALQAASGCPYFTRNLSYGMSGSVVFVTTIPWT